MGKKASTRTRRDRWADWMVLAVLAIALLLGWGVMLTARSERATYVDAGTGLSVAYPRGWLVKADNALAFQAVDPESADFKTTYQVRAAPMDATAPVTPTLAMALNDASLLRAQQGTAYRLFDIMEGRDLGGRQSMESSYVYVDEPSNLVARKPVVVEGLDIAVSAGDRVFIFSLLASERNFKAAEARFRDFVRSAGLK